MMNRAARGLRMEHARVLSFHERMSEPAAGTGRKRFCCGSGARDGLAERLRWGDQPNGRRFGSADGNCHDLIPVKRVGDFNGIRHSDRPQDEFLEFALDGAGIDQFARSIPTFGE